MSVTNIFTISCESAPLTLRTAISDFAHRYFLAAPLRLIEKITNEAYQRYDKGENRTYSEGRPHLAGVVVKLCHAGGICLNLNVTVREEILYYVLHQFHILSVELAEFHDKRRGDVRIPCGVGSGKILR